MTWRLDKEKLPKVKFGSSFGFIEHSRKWQSAPAAACKLVAGTTTRPSTLLKMTRAMLPPHPSFLRLVLAGRTEVVGRHPHAASSHLPSQDRSPWGYMLPKAEKDEKHVSFREARDFAASGCDLHTCTPPQKSSSGQPGAYCYTSLSGVEHTQ